ncbi:MAG: hypothetical protein AB7N24_09610 [Dehalococcoidia bacterium]
MQQCDFETANSTPGEGRQPVYRLDTAGQPRFPFLAIRMGRTPAGVTGEHHAAFGHRMEDDQGSWAEWHWDGESLVAKCDANGFLPLFYAQGPGPEFFISSSLVELVRQGVPTRLDHAALAVFFRLGYFLGNDTPFEDIKVLPAGARLVWSREHFLLKNPPRPVVAEYTGSRESALDEFISRFRTSIAHRPPAAPGFSLPLSGGRDSRHILFELVRQGFAPAECVTLSGGSRQPGTDADAAARVAAAVGVPHRLLGRKPSRSGRRHPTKGVLTHFCADEHEWFLPLVEYFHKRAGCTYNGVAGTWEPEGGTPLTERASDLMDDGNVELVPHLLFQNFRVDERRLKAVLSGDQMKAMPLELAESRLKSELSRYGDCPNPLGTFWFENRERRELGLVASGILGGMSTVYVPYLDHDVVSFMRSLPTRFFREGPFHHDALIRAFPEYADIPFAPVQTSMIEERGLAGKTRLLAGLLGYTLRNNPRRIPTAVRFGAGRLTGTPAMSYRMTSYLIELEALTAAAP